MAHASPAFAHLTLIPADGRTTLFGARRTGRLLVDQALSAGHAVTILVRDLTILAAMHKLGRRRLITSTGVGVSDPQVAPGPINHFICFMLGVSARYIYEDMPRATANVRASDPNWTVVRAPRLTGQPGTGQLKAG